MKIFYKTNVPIMGKNYSKLSKELTEHNRKEFSKQNLHNFLKFNELFSDLQIVHLLSKQLTWTHLQNLIYIKDELKREFYIQLCCLTN